MAFANQVEEGEPSASRMLSKHSALAMVPEKDSDNDESSFEALPLGNFSARRRRKRVATRVPRSRLRRLCGFWKCRHLYCHIHPFSRRAMICRLVKRPFWAIVIIL